MCRSRDISSIHYRLVNIGVSPETKENVQYRYLSVLHSYSARRSRYSWAFHSLRLIITVGSLIVPAILSFPYFNGAVQADSGAAMSFESYLVTWVLSLLVTISNGLMSLMKIEKKYYIMNTVYEQLLSEGWQYINLTGRYGPRKGDAKPTHELQAPLFTHMIEKIRMKQIEDEYFKGAQESVSSAGTTSGAASSSAASSGTNEPGKNTSLDFNQITPFINTESGAITVSQQKNSTQEVNGRHHTASVSLYSSPGPSGPTGALPTIVEEGSSNESGR
jgi:hypothetical protein